MPREAEKPVVDGAARSHHLPRASLRPSWPMTDVRWLAMALRALLIAATFGFWLRVALIARKRHLNFPPVAKLDILIASAQEKLKSNPQDLDTLVQLGTLHFQKGKDS